MTNSFITRNREPFYELARPYISPEKKILDIGAGDGSFANYFNLSNIYLIDGNQETVLKYKKEFKNYYHSKLPALPFENKMFHVIHISHVLEHLNAQDFYETLCEINRCLCDDGVLIISMPLLSDFFYDDLSHYKPYNPTVLIKYLTKTKHSNLTRKKISDNFVLIKLQYRYESKKILQWPEIPNHKLFWFLNKFFGAMRKIGIQRYIRTGYTIILKKKL